MAYNTNDLANANSYRDFVVNSGAADLTWISVVANADASRTTSQASAQASWVSQQSTLGNSSLSYGNAANSEATLTWARQYAPSRTALISAKSVANAERQKAYWQETVQLNTARAEADINYLSSLATTDLNYLISTSADENLYNSKTREASNSAFTQITAIRADSRTRINQAHSSVAVEAASAWKIYLVAQASRGESDSSELIRKRYEDAVALISKNANNAIALVSKEYEIASSTTVSSYFATEDAEKKRITVQKALSSEIQADNSANIYRQFQLDYQAADSRSRIESTTADNRWRQAVSSQYVLSNRGDLLARSNVQRTIAERSGASADQVAAKIAEERTVWWNTQLPQYLQWSTDVSAIEANYTSSVTANVNQRKAVALAAEVELTDKSTNAIKTFELTSSAAQEVYLAEIRDINIRLIGAEASAEYQLSTALADAEYQLQLTGNQSTYQQTKAKAKADYETVIATATSLRDKQQKNS